MKAQGNPESALRPVLDFIRRRIAKAVNLDAGLLLALLLGLLAAVPFLTRASLPHQTDAELHVYRTAELSRIVAQGVVYPRWASDLYLGYGYPLFHYYAPLTYHLGHVFARVLPGAGIVTGAKAVFVSGLLLASLGAYLLGRGFSTPAGGILAAASFALSPYVAFIDPLARGDMAEHFAVCLLPLTFYLFERLISAPNRRRLLISVLALSAIVFSHNLLGLVTSGLLLAYWGWKTAGGVGVPGSRWSLMAFGLAAGLIAFFWVPALVEYDAVKLEVVGPGHFDFREHFSCVSELLAPSRRLDWGAVGPRFRHNLGLGQWVLAVPVLLVVGRQMWRCDQPGCARSMAFYMLTALGLVFLMLPVSTFVWESMPAMPYLQFPWRLLGPANLMLAVCAAGAASLFEEGPWRRGYVTAGLAFVLATAFPLLFPAPWAPDFGGTSPLDIIEWERKSQALGTTSTGDFLPSTVEMAPGPADTLIRSYRDRGLVDKVNRATLREGTDVAVLSHGPTHDLFQVTTARPFVLRLYTFDFPGWTAYVDGEKVPIEIARPEGFITVPLSRGEHRVLVRFEDTGIRKLAWAITGLTVVVLGAILSLWKDDREDASHHYRRMGNLRGIDALCLAVPILLTFIARGVAVHVPGWAYLNSPPGEAIPAQYAQGANFGGEIGLLGYDLPQQRIRPGERLRIVLYWRALGSVKKNYQSFVHMAQPLDWVWAQEDHLNPGGLPTTRWPTDQYVWDAYDIRVPVDTPPGEYSVNVGIYLSSEGYRLQTYGEGGRRVGDSLVIGTVKVVK